MATRWPQILQCWKSFITRFYIENFSTKPLTHTIILSPPPPLVQYEPGVCTSDSCGVDRDAPDRSVRVFPRHRNPLWGRQHLSTLSLGWDFGYMCAPFFLSLSCSHAHWHTLRGRVLRKGLPTFLGSLVRVWQRGMTWRRCPCGHLLTGRPS